MKCEICGKEYSSLSRHIKTHKISSKIYYDMFLKDDDEGKCLVCGAPTKFIKFSRGYKKYCSITCMYNDENYIKSISESNKITHSKPEYIKKQRKIWSNKSLKEIEIIVNKRKQTSLKIYGVDNPYKLNKIQEKAFKTKLNNRPDDPTNRKKYKDTMIKNHNVTHNWATGTLRDKEIKKWIELWGVDNCMRVPEICKKQHDSFAKNHNGARTRWQIPELQKLDAAKANSHEARKKAINTLMKNKQRSSWEVLIANELNSINLGYFEEYNKDERYPFLCDFYIPFFDMFIEIHGTWMHNNHIFDKNNPADIRELDIWKEKAKTSTRYGAACEIWSNRDVLKYNTAIENNLNYIILWTMDDVHNFIHDIAEVWNEVK